MSKESGASSTPLHAFVRPHMRIAAMFPDETMEVDLLGIDADWNIQPYRIDLEQQCLVPITDFDCLIDYQQHRNKAMAKAMLGASHEHVEQG